MSDIKQVLHDIEICSYLPDACGDCSKFTVNRNRCMEELMADAYALLKDPDRIKVTRCKDCKHATMTSDGRLCKYCELVTDDDGCEKQVYYDANWYCADGERQ